MYSYQVKIINPQHRKDSVVGEMRQYHGKLSSIVELKVKIFEEFVELVPANTTFAVGYFDGRQSNKRWICLSGDLNACTTVMQISQKKKFAYGAMAGGQ